MKVTIFGGSSPKADSTAYQIAYDLGNALAKAGHTVITGGYMGTMEAASKGANEAGGHVIGVTCEEIENWRNAKHNPWVKEEIREATLQKRIETLIASCDAAIAVPGGPGTLAEIMLMCNFKQIEVIPQKPIILFGEGWKSVMVSFFRDQNEYISESARNMIDFADSIDKVLAILPLPPSGD